MGPSLVCGTLLGLCDLRATDRGRRSQTRSMLAVWPRGRGAIVPWDVLGMFMGCGAAGAARRMRASGGMGERESGRPATSASASRL